VRFTLDSNILVRSVISPGGPALRLLDEVLQSHILVLSPFILFELERVLLYPRIQSRYRITPLEAARLAQNLGNASQLVEPRISRRLVRDDPADDYVIYTAAEGNADVLCTLNTRHFAAPEVREFCTSKGIRVMTDVEALRSVLG
jgi:putative PIN family toxin of toxin-antitoxin system